MRSHKLVRTSSRLLALFVLVALVAACAPVAAPAAPAAKAPAAAAGKTYEVIFVPKLIGIPWFNTMEKGFKDYAAKKGNLNFTTMGATDTDPAAQARMIEDAIAKKPDCIIVVPNDTATVEPLMKKGMDAGILMLTQEAPTIQNAVADIEFLILEKEGRDMMDLLVKNIGDTGGYAIMVGGLTVEGHNKRADAMVKYQEANFPKLKQVTSRLEGSENVQTAHDKVLELITAYPDLKGMIIIGSLGGVGAAQAVKEKNLIGKLAIVGSSVPSQAKPYLTDKSMAADYIGNPYKIGLDSGYLIEQLLGGKKLADLTNLPVYGEAKVNGKVITFHADTEVTSENADAFGF
ncbi:MAG: substrate-binding domain-containing protein [Caldilineaceae bacterium]